jgi:NTE family protein
MEVARREKRTGLILSGGGARGFAHIGVLKVLEHTDINIDVIAGTSMGAILGALYANGYSADEIYKLSQDISWRDVLDFSMLSGLLKGEKFHQLLATHLPADFKDLQKPLAVATTDIETGEEVFITEGDLISALRASSCYPGMFEPLQFRGRTLADGGIVNNLPVEAGAFLDATYTIASDTTPPRRATFVDPNSEGNWWERFMATVRFERRNPMAQMLMRSTDIMQSILTDMQYTLHPADIRVRHIMPHVRVESFWSFEEIVSIGEKTAIHTFQDVGLIKGEITPSFAVTLKTPPVPTSKAKSGQRLPAPKMQDTTSKFMLNLPKLLTPSRSEQAQESKNK